MTNKQRMKWAVLSGFLGLSAISAFGFEAPDPVIWSLAGLAGLALSPEAAGVLAKLRGR